MKKHLKKLIRGLTGICMAVTFTACGAIVPPMADSIDESELDAGVSTGSADVFHNTPTPNFTSTPTPAEDEMLTPTPTYDPPEHHVLDDNVSYRALDVENLMEQLNLIAEKKDVWFVADDAVLYDYTVADMDCNGRLEIVRASTQGTGFFSYNNIWEVNEDFSDLLAGETTEGDYRSDMVEVENVPVFYDSQNKSVHYIYNDYLRNGMMGNANTIIDFCITNNSIKERPIATMITLYSDLGEESIEYKDSVGEIITEDAYKNCAQKMFSSAKAGMAVFGWARTMNRDIDDAEGPYLREVLYDVCDRFQIVINQ